MEMDTTSSSEVEMADKKRTAQKAQFLVASAVPGKTEIAAEQLGECFARTMTSHPLPQVTWDRVAMVNGFTVLLGG